MSLSRREWLHLVAGGAAALTVGCGPKVAPARPVAVPRTPPHYYVFVFLVGGMDNVLSFHGLDQSVVGDAVDCGYRADERLQGSRRLFGPCIGGIIRHDADMAIVHGVRSDTVSHQTGMTMLTAGKRYGDYSQPSFVKRLTPNLGGNSPLPAVLLLPKHSFFAALAPDKVPQLDPFTLVRATDPSAPKLEVPPWFAALGNVEADSARRLLTDPEMVAEYAEELRVSGVLQDWLPNVRRTTTMRDPNVGPALELALDGIRKNKAQCFLTVTAPDYFDTHSENDRLQRIRLPAALDDIATFVDVLKSERNEFGTLFEQTTVVIASELGRYPKVNQALGKDHWPENSWVLLGKGIKGGVTVGSTDKQFKGLPVGYASGSATDANKRPIYIDTLFATIAQVLVGDAALADYRSDDVLHAIVA